MTTSRVSIFHIVALLFLSSACKTQEKPQQEHVETLPPLQPIIEAGEEGLTKGHIPTVSISVNGGLELKVQQGTPLVLSSEIGHPFRAPLQWRPPSLVLKDKQGVWTSLVHLVVTNSHKEVVSWPWTFETNPAGTLELDHENTGTLRALLPPEATAQLTPGAYTVTLVLDSTQNGASDSFQGRVEANPASIEILPASTVLATAAEIDEARRRTTYFLARGQKSNALEVANTLVSKFPDRPDALGVKADVLEEMGDLKGAYDLFSRAAEMAAQQNPTPDEPSSFDLRRAEIRRHMVAPK